MHLGTVPKDVSMDIGEIPVIQNVLLTVQNRLVIGVLGSVSPVSQDFGETPVHYCVHRFVTGESVTNNGYCAQGCTPGRFGEICDQICSSGCKNGTCNRQSGICLDGCNPNWSGDHCDSECWKM